MSASKGVNAGQERPAVMGRYKPDWLEKPSGEDMEWAYPAHAQRRDIEGKATITCKVAYDGRLSDCRVISESPRGEDFGLAAVALSQKFRMLPPPEGQGAKPAEVTIPVVFKMPQDSRSWLETTPATIARPKQPEPALAPLDSGDMLLLAGVAAMALALLALLFVASSRPGR